MKFVNRIKICANYVPGLEWIQKMCLSTSMSCLELLTKTAKVRVWPLGGPKTRFG